MGLIAAWVGYRYLKYEVQKGYIQATADLQDLIQSNAQPHPHFGILDGNLVDLVTGEIINLPKTTEVTEEMEETARARHDLTAD
jgi:hypothetical protein